MNSFVSIILVEPENPDNIGAVARAMKNMGFCDLRLVRPVKQWKKKGKKLAMAACDVLVGASAFPSVEEVVSDLNLVIGTTRRSGPKRGAFLGFEDVIARIKKVKFPQRVGIMFGKESKGLDNQSLNCCDWVTMIPSHPAYPSINLAQAVMIMCFSLFDRSVRSLSAIPRRGSFKRKEHAGDSGNKLMFLPQKEVWITIERFRSALDMLGYGSENREVRERICSTLKRLFKRNGLIESEAQMFKGISRRICEIVGGERKLCSTQRLK
ncbi:MAG: TrmH family RNA methyltransferase [Candidatus Omnitrophica bacterium]|nr:TrmH family RNA methyltransferase [Candidatus Omnitrophota bacterium]